MIEPSERVSCTFESCEPSVVERVVGAAVDQLCAENDIDIALLDALEHPLGESLSALAPFGIARVDIEVTSSTLRLDVHLESDIADPVASLGDTAEVVLSFFDLKPLDRSREISLLGSLA